MYHPLLKDSTEMALTVLSYSKQSLMLKFSDADTLNLGMSTSYCTLDLLTVLRSVDDTSNYFLPKSIAADGLDSEESSSSSESDSPEPDSDVPPPRKRSQPRAKKPAQASAAPKKPATTQAAPAASKPAPTTAAKGSKANKKGESKAAPAASEPETQPEPETRPEPETQPEPEDDAEAPAPKQGKGKKSGQTSGKGSSKGDAAAAASGGEFLNDTFTTNIQLTSPRLDALSDATKDKSPTYPGIPSKAEMDAYTPNQRGSKTKSLSKRLEKCVDEEEWCQVQDALDYLASKKKAKSIASKARKTKKYKSAATISDSEDESAPPRHSFSGIAGLAREVRGARRAAERPSSSDEERPDFDQEHARPSDEDRPDPSDEHVRPSDEDRPDLDEEHAPPSDDQPPPPTPPPHPTDMLDNVAGLGGALTPTRSEGEGVEPMDIDESDIPDGSSSCAQRSPEAAHPDEPAKKRVRTEGE